MASTRFATATRPRTREQDRILRAALATNDRNLV